ncbi:MAG: GGDEF domain-containing protein [Clostridiales bacterium]|nr:GGDEF domain-containing protein [Clostridiales bacterium]
MKNILNAEKNLDMDYKIKILYLLILLVIVSSSVFLGIYILFAPFKPAIIVHLVYILFHVSLLYFVKKKKYLFVKFSILITFIVQLTLAVYLWFPVTTGYNLFYYMVPIAAFLTIDVHKTWERYLAFSLSVIATLFFLGSVVYSMDIYLYVLDPEIETLIHTLTIISTILPATFIFYRYTIDLSMKQNELRHLANTDALTQVTNRRVLFEQGKKEVMLAYKYAHEFTLIQLDIDHFKFINDSFGHPVGDEILIQLTQVIRQHIRKEDTFSRHGGEEFAIIIRKTTWESGMEVAEKLRSVVENEAFIVGDIEVKITISIGVTQYTREYSTFDEMMRVSDKALYKAKNKGRNCVVLSSI